MTEGTESHAVKLEPANGQFVAEAEPLADRLHRLEQTLAALQNTETLEQQLTARVMARLQEQAAANGLAAGDASGIGGYVPVSAESFWDRLGSLREFKLMFRMYFDPRYRLSRVVQFAVPIVLGLMVLNYFFAAGIPFIGFFVERIVLVILGVVLYKLLSREAARYDAVLKYLAVYGR
jgi:hypothetical protein